MSKANRINGAWGLQVMNQPHTLLVDHREQGSELACRLADNPAWSVAFVQLDIGDYLIDDRILIERKSLVDLAASIKDGRLFRQTLRLAAKQRVHATDTTERAKSSVASDPPAGSGAAPNTSDALKPALGGASGQWICALLVEGTAADLRDSKMTGASLRAALATVSLFFGIPVLRSTHAVESAQLLESIAKQSATVVNGGLPRLGVRPKGKRRLQLHLLQGLPGIGPERAARLLDHFGSVRAVMAADAGDLRAVPGIGPTCARRIVWSVGEEPAGYTTMSAPAKTRI